MVLEAPTLYPELDQRITPPGKGQHAYFQRLRDGWIVTHIAHPAAVQDMNFKGFIRLDQFGTWVMPGPGTGSTVKDRRGIPFNPGDEPWRLIFQHAEGAVAFPVEQVIAYRWHIRPPYREVRFPQVEGIEIFDLFCPECEKGIFSAPEEQDAANLLRQHLTSRFDDPHSYRPEDLRALGQEIGVNFFAERRVRRGRRVRGDGQTLEPPAQAPDLQPNETLTCPECGAGGFESGRQLQGHRLSHSRERKKSLSAAPA